MDRAVLAAVLAEIAVCEKALRARNVPARHVPDLVQECRIAAWRALEVGGLLDGPVRLCEGQLDKDARARVRGWLWRVAERAACAFHTRSVGAREQPRAELDSVMGAVAPSPEQLALERDPHAKIEAALAELARTAPDQHAVVVAYAADHKIREIAAAFEVPPNTVWNRLTGARAFVRSYLAREEAREQGQLARRTFAHQLAGAPS